MPENSSAFSPSKIADSGGVFSFFPRSSDTTDAFPSAKEEPYAEEPQSEEPQPEDTSADVHEQTADPASSVIASVVSSIQTSTAPPQGNILSMKPLSMNLLFPFYNHFC